LQLLVDEVLVAMPAEIERYRSGKVNLLGVFVGEVMKKSKGKADPKLTSELLRKKLDV
jgi:aspartyl-tRNA(Asn)/glutamyl-tRNA(Gln) amidotransferase subunit B